MISMKKAQLRVSLAAASTAVLAACSTATPVAVVTAVPPPPKAEVVPYRPLPPLGASYVMDIPRRDASGLRRTVNTSLTDDEVVWHFRSGWNVAALNCSSAQYQPVVDAYGNYIKKHARPLKRVNDRIDQVYRQQQGSRRAGIKAREAKMTMVYNFFALPPARTELCRNALDIASRSAMNPSQDPIAFAKDNFHLLTSPFENFFNAYEQYEQASAAWDAQYGDRYGASQPGYIAVLEARYGGKGLPPSSMTASYPKPTAAPATPGSGSAVATPVVQPVANDEDGSAS